MARLRKPSPNEPTIFQLPSEAGAIRSSPRKAVRNLRYTTSSDEEESILVPKASSRDLRCISSQQADESFSIRNMAPPTEALSPRKQRVLRPVESNSRLLRKLSGQSLASPEKKQRDRRVRSGTTDVDVGNKTRLMYARTLAKSVVKKQASRANISVVGDYEVNTPVATPSRVRDEKVVDILEDEEVEEMETTIICGDGDEMPMQDSSAPSEESSENEEDVVTRQRPRQRYARRITSDSEDDEEEVEEAKVEPGPLRSMRPPHRKGHSMISDWAQDVIELTNSPEAPSSSFVVPPLPPPSRKRGESIASERSQTSCSSALAILTYSPTPTKFRSPCKAPPTSRPSTPPLAPPSPSKLVSPSKKKPAIPRADIRPSLDAFWNPEVINEWNEKHSPVKALVSPKKQKWREDIAKMMDGVNLEDSGDSDTELPSPTTSPRKKKPAKLTDLTSPSKDNAATKEPSVKDIRAQRKDFTSRKHGIAQAFLLELDNTICAGKISSMSQQTGGIKLVWSKTLQTTAGRANWRREQLRLRTGPQPSDFKLEVRHHCSIELAEKVIDDEARLYNVLAHEFCHLTTFMINDVRNNPHGAEFKSWGRKVSTAFGDRGVEVTTKHSYAIEYKYIWECIVCGYEFKRQSRSVDPVRHSCGKCKGKLVQTKPKPRTVAAGKDGKEKSGYQVFVKSNFARIRKEMGERGEDTQMGKVMVNVAKEYKAQQSSKQEDADENRKAKTHAVDEADLQRALKSLEI